MLIQGTLTRGFKFQGESGIFWVIILLLFLLYYFCDDDEINLAP